MLKVFRCYFNSKISKKMFYSKTKFKLYNLYLIFNCLEKFIRLIKILLLYTKVVKNLVQQIFRLTILREAGSSSGSGSWCPLSDSIFEIFVFRRSEPSLLNRRRKTFTVLLNYFLFSFLKIKSHDVIWWWHNFGKYLSVRFRSDLVSNYSVAGRMMNEFAHAQYR